MSGNTLRHGTAPVKYRLVACPWCDAKAFAVCVTKNGQPTRAIHRYRIEEARRQYPGAEGVTA